MQVTGGGGKLGAVDKERGRRIGQQAQQFASGEPPVERLEHRPDFSTSKPEIKKGDAVVRQDRHPVATLDPQTAQQGCRAGNGHVPLTIANRAQRRLGIVESCAFGRELRPPPDPVTEMHAKRCSHVVTRRCNLYSKRRLSHSSSVSPT